MRHKCDNREFQVVRDKWDDEWTMADDLGDSASSWAEGRGLTGRSVPHVSVGTFFASDG